ncbi:helix-turn-helix transcriptional regulator [Zhengella sp. ZM62]|uniref:helix-turn-helix transcriptional regulator n=1 Tax=Zhengella sedimenti TaxID=3390035 RepID=UPI003974DDBA
MTAEQGILAAKIRDMCEAARSLGLHYAVLDSAGAVAGETSGDKDVLPRLAQCFSGSLGRSSGGDPASARNWENLDDWLPRAGLIENGSGEIVHYGFLPPPEEARQGREPPRIVAVWRNYSPDQGAYRDPAVVALYGLAPLEARIASAIADGETVAGIARDFGISESTVRARLKKIFKKTGTKTQHQLTVLVWRLRV